MSPSPTLQFLGTGSAFTTDPDNFHANLLLTGSSGARLLVDCGSDARRALHARGLTVKDLSAVYVSHLHADHVGGLEWLGFSTHFGSNTPRLTLYVPEPIADPLWNNVLAGGMQHIVGGSAELTTYFDVVRLPERGGFTFEGVDLRLVPTPHVRGSTEMVTSYGLWFQGPSRSVYLTGDTELAWHDELETADVVLHDCEIAATPTETHPPYRALVERLPPAVRNKTWLYGYPSGSLPNAVADGFAGFARPRQAFEL